MADYIQDNLFARILQGHEARVLLEQDEHLVAFVPATLQAHTHAIIIPRKPYPSFAEFSAQASQEELAHFFRIVGRLAHDLGLSERGYRLVTNTGPDAGQRVPHFHVHLLGGEPLPLLFGEAPADVAPLEALLVLLPWDEEPDPEQVAGFSRLLDINEYDARIRIRSKLPRVILRGEVSQVYQVAEELSDLRLPTRCMPIDELLADFDHWLVEEVERSGEVLILTGSEGKLDLPLESDALLVRGYYSASKRPGSGGAKRRHGSSSSLAKSTRRQFGHIYREGLRPLSFVETRIRSYAFLSDAMQISARANFEALMDLLEEGTRITYTPMLHHAGQVSAAVVLAWAGPGRPASSSPDVDADLLSRIVHHSMLAQPEGVA